ncbi:nucleotidyltransferase domain-containing protein [soil metagenome]
MAPQDVRVAAGALEAAGSFAAELRRRFADSVVEVRLYGSYARGEAHEESDVDVAVVLEDARWATQREVIDIAADTGLRCGLVFSPSIFDRDTYARWRRQERPLAMDIERDGIPL